MNNLDRFNGIFKEVFSVDDTALNEHLNRDEVSSWDSIHQLNLISYIEEAFDLMLDADDVLDITSYEKCKNMLSEKYDIQF